MNFFSLTHPRNSLQHKVIIFTIGAGSGALAFPLAYPFTILALIPIFPGLIFGFFVVWLSRYYGICKRIWWWLLGGSLSYLAAFAVIFGYGLQASSSKMATSYSLGFGGLAGGLVLYLFAKMIFKYAIESWSFVLLTISFTIPFIFYFIVAGEVYIIFDPMFGIPEPTVKYVLPVMMVWQGTALLAIDFLLRYKTQNVAKDKETREQSDHGLTKWEILFIYLALLGLFLFGFFG